MDSVLQSNFVSHLIRINHLDACDFDRLIFFDGMLFMSDKKWWGSRGIRESLHEGLDLCFFSNTNNEKFRLDETILVPMIYDGTIDHITDDFLGKTIITSHHFEGEKMVPLLSLFGHVVPDKNLRIGDSIKAGEIVARISGFQNRQRLLPHLHISLAKAQLLPPANRLEWGLLNKADRSVFVDPLNAIAPGFTVMEYDDSLNLAKIFSKCSQANTAS